MSDLPPAQAPLYNHPLPALERWLIQLGAVQRGLNSCLWDLHRPDWTAEIELEVENVGRFGKRTGSYTGVGTLSQLKFTVTDNFRVAPGLSFSSTSVSGVPDMLDSHRTAFSGASMEFRYKLLDREIMPFGLTLHAAPGWSSTCAATATPM